MLEIVYFLQKTSVFSHPPKVKLLHKHSTMPLKLSNFKKIRTEMQ